MLASLARFLMQYPEISLEISADAALTNIVAGRFDAGIRPGERVERDMIAVRIGGEVRSVVVAAPDYLARHPRPTTPRDLEAHNCIMFRLPSGAVFSWPFEKKGQRLEAAVSGRLTINDEETAVRAPLDGVGVLYTALDHVAPLIVAGRLVPLARGLEDELGRPLFLLPQPTPGVGADASLHRLPTGERAGALRREDVKGVRRNGPGTRYPFGLNPEQER